TGDEAATVVSRQRAACHDEGAPALHGGSEIAGEGAGVDGQRGGVVTENARARPRVGAAVIARKSAVVNRQRRETCVIDSSPHAPDDLVVESHFGDVVIERTVVDRQRALVVDSAPAGELP